MISTRILGLMMILFSAFFLMQAPRQAWEALKLREYNLLGAIALEVALCLLMLTGGIWFTFLEG